MASAENIVFKIIGDSTNFLSALGQAEGGLKKLKGGINNLTSAFTPFSMAAVGALGASVKMAADFDKQVVGATRALDLTTAEVAKFKQEIQGVQKDLKYQFSTTELAGIATEAAKLGIVKKDIDDFTKSISKIAVATDQMGKINQLTTDSAKIATVFKFNAKQTDTFLNAVNKLDDSAAVTAPDILNYTKRVAGIGAQSKLTAENLAAYGTALMGAGAKPQVAATFMNKFLTALGAAENLSKPAKARINELGYSATDLAKAFDKDANAAMTDFMKRVQKLDSISQKNVLGKIFGQEHVDTAMLLMQQMKELEKFQKMSADAGGNAAKSQREFNTAAMSFAGQSRLLKNQINEIGVSLGTILMPGILSVTSKLTPLLAKLVALTQKNPEISKMIVMGLGVIAIIAPLGMLLSAIVSIVGAIGALIGFVVSASAAIGGFLIAIGAMAAIAGVVVGMNYLISKWGEVSAAIRQVSAGVMAVPGIFATAVSQIVTVIGGRLTGAISNITSTVGYGLAGISISVGELIANVSGGFINLIANISATVASGVMGIMGTIFNLTAAIARAIYQLPGFVARVVPAMISNFSRAFSGMMSAVSSFIGRLGGMGSRFGSMAYSWGQGLLRGFMSGIQSQYAAVAAQMNQFTSWIGQYLPQSDAKKGALSHLTASGMAFTQTFMAGVDAGGIGALGGMLQTPQIGASMPSLAAVATPASTGGSTQINFNPSYTISASNNSDLMEQLKRRDKELLDLINRATNRVDRKAY